MMRDRLLEVETRIQAACVKSMRSRDDVTLIAVSKFFAGSALLEAHALGCRNFGENYVQELSSKRNELSLPGATFHMIGPLQRNKAKALLQGAVVVHTVDSERLLVELAKHASTIAPTSVFVQVNIDREPQKSGCNPDDLKLLADQIRAQPALKLQGLMAIPKANETAEQTRPSFTRLRMRRDNIDVRLALSMGMSSDFEVAIEEGATHIRIGSAIFGARPITR